MPADQSGSESGVPPSGGPSDPELPPRADAPLSNSHGSSEPAQAVTELDTARDLTRRTRVRVSEAIAKLRSARRDAITAAGTPGNADAVAVRVDAEACLAEVRTALLDAEAYEAEMQAALPIEPTPEPTGRLIMPNISQINLSAPQGLLSDQVIAPNALPLPRSGQCKHGVTPPEMCDICSKWLTKEELGDVLYPQVQSFFELLNSGVFAAVFHDVDHAVRFGSHDSGADSQYEPTVDRGMLSRAMDKYNDVIGTVRAQQKATASALAALQTQYLTDTGAAASRANAVDAQLSQLERRSLALHKTVGLMDHKIAPVLLAHQKSEADTARLAIAARNAARAAPAHSAFARHC